MVLGKFLKFFKKTKEKKSNKKKTIKKLTKKKALKKTKRKTVKRPIKKQAGKKEKLIANTTHYFKKIKVAILKMKSSLKINDIIHIKGNTTDFKQKVASIQINHEPVKMAKKGQEIGILVKGKVRQKDKVYKV